MGRNPQLDDPEVTLQRAVNGLAPVAQTIVGNPEATLRPHTLAVPAESAPARLLSELRGTSAAQRFAMGDTLGVGGMGVVRVATQRALGRSVAVKTLRENHDDEVELLGLLREGWITGSLEHPNIVPVHDIQLDDAQRPMIVLKRIDGEPWADLMLHDARAIERRFGTPDRLEWNLGVLMQVCNAIHFAHSRGIVHRDLKPDNIMIGEFGEVYVLDWGIAVAMQDDGSGRLPLASDALEAAGTPHYMAPEMLGGEVSRISPSTDVYLLGAILYELLGGRPPHDGESLEEIARSVLEGPPALTGPEELVRIVDRAMDPDPDARFETAVQVRLALQGFLQHRGSRRLAAQADLRLQELEELLDASRANLEQLHGRPSPNEERRARVHELFSECRFGYREALATWPDNGAARDGAVRAAIATAEYELAAGDGRAALRVLTTVQAPPADLLARTQKAAQAQGVTEARRAKLESDHDLSTGRRTRTVMMALLGTQWTVMPLVSWHFDLHETVSFGHLMLLPVALLIPVLVFTYWARETLRKTLVNRRLVQILILAILGQSLLTAGAWMAGLTTDVVQVMYLFLWSSAVAVTAIAIDRRLWLTAAGYAIGFLVAAWKPEMQMLVVSACNFVLAVNAVFVWAPPEFLPRSRS